MTQPWETSALVAALKSKGIADAERLAEHAIDAIIDWTVESCTLEVAAGKSAYGIGALILPEVKKMIDKGIEDAIAKA